MTTYSEFQDLDRWLKTSPPLPVDDEPQPEPAPPPEPLEEDA